MIAVEVFCLLSLLLVAGKFLRVGIPLLRKLYLPGVVFAVSALFAAEQDPPVIERSNPRTYHIRSAVTASVTGTPPDKLFIITPLPESSQYQTVSGETVSSGQIRRFPLDCGRYAFYSARRKFPPLVAAKSKNIVEYARLAYLYMTDKFKYGRAPDISLRSIWRCRRGAPAEPGSRSRKQTVPVFVIDCSGAMRLDCADPAGNVLNAPRREC